MHMPSSFSLWSIISNYQPFFMYIFFFINLIHKLTMTKVLGLNVFTATETPAIRPPPPTGIMTASTFLTCSIISRPMVPAPARIDGWSYLKGKVQKQLSFFKEIILTARAVV